MKLRYISIIKRQYPKLGKEFPNNDNEIEVEDSLGAILLRHKVGKVKLWEEIKERKSKSVEQEIIKEDN